MTPGDFSTYTAQDLQDPSIDHEDLQKITVQRPDLWSSVLKHPNCYPELAEYIHSQRPATPQRPSTPPTSQKQFDLSSQVTEAEESHAEAPETTQFEQPTQVVQPQRPSVAPQVGRQQEQTQQTQQAQAHAHTGQHQSTPQPAPTGPVKTAAWRTWMQGVLLVVTVVAIGSLFLPLATVTVEETSDSINYFHQEMPEHTVTILVLRIVSLFLVLVLGAVALLTCKGWLRIITAVLGILIGGVCAYDGIVLILGFSEMSHVSIEIGSLMLAIMGVILALISIITLLPARKKYQ